MRCDLNAQHHRAHERAMRIARAMQKICGTRCTDDRHSASRDIDRAKNFIAQRSWSERATTIVQRRRSIAIASSNRCAYLAKEIAHGRVSASESHRRIIGTRKSIGRPKIDARTPNPRLAGKRVVLSHFHPRSRPDAPLIIAFAKKRCIDATPPPRASAVDAPRIMDVPRDRRSSKRR
jgi:hypothetical protein